MRTFLKSGGAMLIPFFSFGLGTGIDFTTLVEAGASGIILGLMTAFLGALINVTVSRFVGGTGLPGRLFPPLLVMQLPHQRLSPRLTRLWAH